MANPHRGEVEIKLDKKRILKFGTLALAELEDSLDCSVNDLFKKGSKKLERIKTVVLLLRACLIHEDENLTYRDVANMLDSVEDLDSVVEKISESFDKSTLIKKKETAKKK